ncbi:pyruvate decarboxylase [Kaistella flava (ex Peng et al. 2021)]|uniref:Pyruvate decarboxylase n=1 Tax=Kaistella flava (ex Peng et al. 2021) TaxID=2038776 RepID=A0A7M2Y9L5_9FLAO|nr:pyruvate decarboxylase [Kaistella flava (ex Peng et al. 2021)]QOW10345.1 pyruvate decarboxylase [Kaistella flava (ex Peng et al. 2021)]
MKQIYLIRTHFTILLLLTAYCALPAQSVLLNREAKIYKVLYFNPEVFPDIEEIKEPTYSAFFSALSDHLSTSKSSKLLRVDYDIPYEDSEKNMIAEFCENNNAQYAVVPKVKYFKVGFGKYVFSNQVIVSMKVYNAEGDLLAETSYDTYKKNGRLLGSAENSIKIGTDGALKNINKILRKKYRLTVDATTQFEMFPEENFSYN